MKKAKIGMILSALLLLTILLTPVLSASGEPSNTVRVWVSYQSGRKAEILSALKGAKAQFHYDFPELESYVVSLPEWALNGILRNPFVSDVEPDPVRYPIEPVKGELDALDSDTTDVNEQTVPWGIDAVQARDVWDANDDAVIDTGAPTGEGITVCIIDSGFYAEHDDLKDPISGISQVDDNYLIDGSGHGSHVAGTIGALNNDLGVVGVSPGMVDYHIVKIFNNDGLWASGSDLVSAIYSCRDNGAKVISMSLGGASSNRREQRAFDTLYSNGILHVAAAGNEQIETPGAFSYPASYSSVMSVAAVDSNNIIADFSNQNSAVEIAAPGVSVPSTVPWINPSAVIVDGVSYSASLIEFANKSDASGELVDGGLCDTTGTWSGKVVLCKRGVISFYDKVMNVQNSGGAAAVIYNNVTGNFSGTLGEGASSDIIAVSISQEDGQYLVANKLGRFATVDYEALISGSGYEAWGGTSMATPHVSGVAALIWSDNPSWTNAQIREAMNRTAVDLGASGRDSIFGYGLVQAKAALTYLGGGTVDNPPSVTITSPTDGASLSGTVMVIATATDDVGVDQVEFFVNGGSIGVDSNGSDGWNASWDTTAYTDGAHSLSATATDTAGKTGSDSISVTVSNQGPVDEAPTVYITNPSANATLSGSVEITANASDDMGVTQVEFFVNDESIGVGTESSDVWSFTWDTTGYQDGGYTLSATAADTAGQTASDSITVTVDNDGGTTDPIVLSGIGYKVRGSGYVDLTWSGATTSEVEIYRDGAPLITSTNDGFYTDGPIIKGGGSATYQVCEENSDICSNVVTVTW